MDASYNWGEFHGTSALLGNDSDLGKYLESPGEETILERGQKANMGVPGNQNERT